MTELGLDIDEEILLRLQANDLIPCKRVCKSWYSLISSHRFIKSHLNRQHSNGSGETRIIVSRVSMRLENRLLSRRLDKCQVIGSSNGLVCISSYNDENMFFVINPSTREIKELPYNYPCSCHVYASGFGYDSSIDDYKVLVGRGCLPNEFPEFNVLELKTNIWRSIVVESEYDYLVGNGILCNGALYWLNRRYFAKPRFEIVSFDLSKEGFKKLNPPKLDANYKWNLGTMKARLCVFRLPDANLINDDGIEMWVMRNDQVSWERKLLPPDYDANKITMTDQVFSKCNYNYNKHVFVKSLVSPHVTGYENGICNEESVKRKGQNVRSPDGDVRSKKSRWESHVFHGPDKGRAKSKRKIHVSSDSDGDGRRVDRKRRKRDRDRFVFHNFDGGRAKSKRQSHVVIDSDDDGRRWDRKMRERDMESLVFHSSDGGRAKSKRQSHVVFDSDEDGRRRDRKRREMDRESLVFHDSDKRRAKSKRQSHLTSKFLWRRKESRYENEGEESEREGDDD